MCKNKIYKDSLERILTKIRNTCEKNKIATSKVSLLGASKKKPASLVREFHSLGLNNFGENYLSEALEKQSLLTDLDITWHYIGQIQSNKTKLLAENFDWIHGVDRLKIAKRLNDQCPSNKKLNVLIQINLDDESTKAGIPLSEALEFATTLLSMKNISLRGLMALPKLRTDPKEQQECLAKLSTKLDEINNSLKLPKDIALDTISAGMSGDLEAAIKAGSTMVRIGTDLFGARA